MDLCGDPDEGKIVLAFLNIICLADIPEYSSNIAWLGSDRMFWRKPVLKSTISNAGYRGNEHRISYIIIYTTVHAQRSLNPYIYLTTTTPRVEHWRMGHGGKGDCAGLLCIFLLEYPSHPLPWIEIFKSTVMCVFRFCDHQHHLRQKLVAGYSHPPEGTQQLWESLRRAHSWCLSTPRW